MILTSWSELAHASHDELRHLAGEKVRFLFTHLIPYHPYYRELLAKHRIDTRAITSTEALANLPFTSKLDLLPSEREPAKPRAFVLQPTETLIRQHAPKRELVKFAAMKLAKRDVRSLLEWEYKPVHLHFTTGRTTTQIPILYPQRDLAVLTETGLRLFETIGARKDDVVVNAFPYAPHLAFWLTYVATTGSGVLSLETGGGKIMGTEKILEAIERMKATILIALPGYGYHLLREAVERGMRFPSLRLIVLGGDRVSQGLRAKLAELLEVVGAKDAHVLATYAFTEGKTAWVQCHPESGYHLYPDLEYIELVGEDGKRVAPGERGEVVYTALDWRGSVVVRYRTGDWCAVLDFSTCRFCGRTVPRLSQDIERRSEVKELALTKVKGELVNLNAVSAVLHATPEVAEWQLEIKKRNDDPYEVDELILHIAAKRGADAKELAAQVEKRITSGLSVRPIVITHELSTLITMLGMENELKEKRIVDRRTGG